MHKVSEARANINGVSKATLIIAVIDVGVGDDVNQDNDVLTLMAEVSTTELSRYTWLLVLHSPELSEVYFSKEKLDMFESLSDKARPKATKRFLTLICWI